MKAAMLYGLMLGMILPLMTRVAPQPAGSVLMWSLLTVQLAWAATLTWKRMGLLFSSLSMAMGSAVTALAAILHAAGYDILSFPMPWAALFWAGCVVGPIVLHVDAFRHPEKWEVWKQHMETIRLRDMLLGRHIPDLRSGTTPSA